MSQHDFEQMTFTSGSLAHVSNEEKRKYQLQLILMLHAKHCQRRTSASTEGGEECNLVHCQEMQQILNHTELCQAGSACVTSNCNSVKALKLHWENCFQNECVLCFPLMQAYVYQQRLNSLNQSSQIDTVPSSVDKVPNKTNQNTNQAAEGKSSLEFPFCNANSVVIESNLKNQVPEMELQSHSIIKITQREQKQQSNIPVSKILQGNEKSRTGTDSTSKLNIAENSDSTGKSETSSSRVVSNTIIPIAPINKKEWHEGVPSEMRHSFIERIIQEIHDVLNGYYTRDVLQIVSYATRREGVMYDSCNDREEYIHFLAEFIYKIRTRTLGEKSETKTVGQQSLLTIANQVTSTFGPFSHVSDLDKQRYHQQLVLLLHAYECQKRNSANSEGRGECNLAQCQGMRHVLSHIQVCQAGNVCAIPNCTSSKALILHWNNCTHRECALCLPLKQAHGHRRRLSPLVPSHKIKIKIPKSAC